MRIQYTIQSVADRYKHFLSVQSSAKLRKNQHAHYNKFYTHVIHLHTHVHTQTHTKRCL